MSDFINPRLKLYNHLDRLTALKAGQKPPPVNVEIDLSNRCSRGCKFCHFSYTHTKGPLAGSPKPPDSLPGGDLMDTALALRLGVELADYGVRSITWSGGGEPTLHPDFDNITAACPIDQGLYTHGGHIAAKRAALLKRKLKWVYVSLDYPDAESYAAVKGGGPDGFAHVVDGIRNLVAAEGPATVGLGFLLNRDNHTRAWDMATLAGELGVDYLQFRPTILYDYAAPNRLAEDTSWITPAFLSDLAQLRKRSDVIVDVSRFDMYAGWRGHPYETCWWSGLQTVITPNGQVWACLNKRNFTGAALGDLNLDFFGVIWKAAPIQCVNDQCRVMCRGHIPNLALDTMLAEPGEHGNFI